MPRRSFVLTLAAALPLAGWCLAQSHKPAAPAGTYNSFFGRNLLKNGGIETITSDNKKVPDWSASPALSEALYGTEAGEWDWGLTGCATCQQRYLSLAFEGSTQEGSAFQTIDATPATTQIDAGKVTAHLSAWLGGFLKSDTTAAVEASFHDASGRELGTLATDPFDSSALPKAQSGSTGLTLCEKPGSVPRGTRKIVYTFQAKATGNSGDYLALGDNFSLELTEATP